jgi:peptidoglycan/LPS O-acetylase OafA/YrhL
MSPASSSDITGRARASGATAEADTSMSRAINSSTIPRTAGGTAVAPVVRKHRMAAGAIGPRIASRDNHLDLLRLVAVFTFIASHYFALRDGDNIREPFLRLTGYSNLGKPALYALFSISGLLGAHSLLASPSTLRYLWNRALRILPALWACVAFCALVVGLAMTHVPLRQYLTSRQTLHFLGNAVLIPNHYELPGVFTQYAYGDPRAAINGSLWSVPVGALMFLALSALCLLRLLKRKPVIWFATLACLLAWLAYEFGYVAQVPGTLLFRHRIWVEFVPHLGFFFFAGALAYLYRDRIVPHVLVFLACLLAIGLTLHARMGYTVLTLCLPYLVLYAAFARIPLLGAPLRSINRFGDFAYGVFLYGWPVQQLLIACVGHRLPPAVHIALAGLGALVLAILSWHLIERPLRRLR